MSLGIFVLFLRTLRIKQDGVLEKKERQPDEADGDDEADVIFLFMALKRFLSVKLRPLRHNQTCAGWKTACDFA